MWSNLHYAAIISCKSGFVLQAVLQVGLLQDCRSPVTKIYSGAELHQPLPLLNISSGHQHHTCTQPGHTTQASSQRLPSLKYKQSGSCLQCQSILHSARRVNHKRPRSDSQMENTKRVFWSASNIGSMRCIRVNNRN